MFHLDGRGRIPASILGGCLAATVGLGATPAAAAPVLGSISFNAGTGLLSVTGTSAADVIVFRSTTLDSVPVLAVDLNGDRAPEAILPAALIKRLYLSGRGADDRLNTTDVPASVRVLVNGGDGDDLLQGGAAAERLLAGPGNDSVDGGPGDDVVYLGSGNDTMKWSPGDGSDRVEGQSGRDSQLFFGSAADENVTIANARGRVRFTRDVGNIRMDLNSIERLDTNLAIGRDTITVGDMSGTSVREVMNRLGNNPGSQGRVIAHGTRRADNVDVLTTSSAAGTSAFVFGLRAQLEVEGAGTEDLLEIRTGGGDDKVNSSVRAGALGFTADGGSGDDQMLGGDADETFVGGAGDDVIDGNRGNDTAVLGDGELDLFIWDPGDGSDRVDGNAGTDVLVFRGANVAERFAVSRTGRGTSRFTRDVGNIVMDLRSVEAIDVTAMGGADDLKVSDLSGSGVRAVVANLSVLPGTPASDAAVDTVTVDGTDAADAIAIRGRSASAAGSGVVEVAGLSAEVRLTRVESTDSLTVNGLGGVDTFDTSRFVPGTVQLTTNQ